MIKNIRDYDGELEADAYINLFEKEIRIGGRRLYEIK